MHFEPPFQRCQRHQDANVFPFYHRREMSATLRNCVNERRQTCDKPESRTHCETCVHHQAPLTLPTCRFFCTRCTQDSYKLRDHIKKKTQKGVKCNLCQAAGERCSLQDGVAVAKTLLGLDEGRYSTAECDRCTTKEKRCEHFSYSYSDQEHDHPRDITASEQMEAEAQGYQPPGEIRQFMSGETVHDSSFNGNDIANESEVRQTDLESMSLEERTQGTLEETNLPEQSILEVDRQSEEEWGKCPFDDMQRKNLSPFGYSGIKNEWFYVSAPRFRFKHAPRLPSEHNDKQQERRDLESMPSTEWTPAEQDELNSKIFSTQMVNWGHRSGGWRYKGDGTVHDQGMHYKPSYYLMDPAFPNKADLIYGPWRKAFYDGLEQSKGTPDEEQKYVNEVLKEETVYTVRRICHVFGSLVIKKVPKGLYRPVLFLNFFHSQLRAGELASMPMWMKQRDKNQEPQYNLDNPFAMPDNTDSRRIRYPSGSDDLRLLVGEVPPGYDGKASFPDGRLTEALGMGGTWKLIWPGEDTHRAHFAMELQWHPSSFLPYIASRMRLTATSGWKMVQTRGPSIRVTSEDGADVLFILEKFSRQWHGHFRFGGLGLLQEIEPSEQEFVIEIPSKTNPSSASKRARTELADDS